MGTTMNQNENEKKSPAYDELDDDFEIEELDDEDDTDNASDRETEDEADSSFSKSAIMHIVLLALIVILASVSIWKLYKWNKGTPSEYDPNEINTEFDTEAEDLSDPSPALL